MAERYSIVANKGLRNNYGVATISTLLKIIGLFRRIWSLLYGSFAKETYHKEPTNRSHPISVVPIVWIRIHRIYAIRIHM